MSPLATSSVSLAHDTIPRRVLPDGASRARIGAAFVLFVYLAILRTRHISETFWLLGDQILYWRMALGSWHDLPLGGGPSSVGGTTLGPAFVWTMWGIRHVIGPWTDNLPHAGGIGLSIIQSAADALLLVAIWKRFSSLALAFAVTLFIATSPEEMSLSASIWNPVLAVAFIKMAIAFVLLDVQDRSLRWSAAATAAAVLAVQCHSSAVFLAGPLIASFPVRELLAKSRDRVVMYACALAAVALVLEAPFLLDLATEAGKRTSPAAVVDSVAYTIEHPGSIRPVAAFHALVDACQAILLRPWTAPWFGSLLVACAAVTAFRARHQAALVAVTVVPLLAAIAGFCALAAAFRVLLVSHSDAECRADDWARADRVETGGSDRLHVAAAARCGRPTYAFCILADDQPPADIRCAGSRLKGDSAAR